MFYLAKLRFETEDDKGKIRKTREQYLVFASSISDAEKKLVEEYGTGISPCQVESIQESKIMKVFD